MVSFFFKNTDSQKQNRCLKQFSTISWNASDKSGTVSLLSNNTINLNSVQSILKKETYY